MIKIQSFFLVAVTLIFIFFSAGSCKKEDEKNDPAGSSGTGSIQYDGKNYPIKYGMYDYFGEFDDIHNFELFLFSDGVNLDNESGTGNVIAIYFYSDVPPLPTGTIPYYSENMNDLPYIEAQVGLEINLETEEGIKIPVFDEGSIRITRSGDTYHVEFTLSSNAMGVVAGNYSGKVSEF